MLATAIRPAVALAAGLLALAATAPAQGQILGAAAAEARARLVCGTGTVLNATYLPGGLLRVTCRAANQPNPARELPRELQGTGLTTTTPLAAITALIVTTIIIGENGTSTTTTGP